MTELKTTVAALQIVAAEFEKLQGVTQAQCIRDAVMQLDQQQKRITELEAQKVDALGDGFYDGYKHLLDRVKKEDPFIDDINDQELINLSEDYESSHRYGKSLKQIKSEAIRKHMNFISNLIMSEIGDFTAGLDQPGEPVGAEAIHKELVERIAPFFNMRSPAQDCQQCGGHGYHHAYGSLSGWCGCVTDGVPIIKAKDGD